VTIDLDQPPHPAPDPDTEGYWEATAAGRLSVARCVVCRTWHHPPCERCPACAGEVAFQPLSGRGTVFGVVAVHQPTVPGYLQDLPYDVALVELDEQPGLRIPVRVPEHGSLAIGDRVELALGELRGSPYRVPTATRSSEPVS